MSIFNRVLAWLKTRRQTKRSAALGQSPPERSSKSTRKSDPKRWLKFLFSSVIVIGVLASIVLATWVFQLDRNIRTRFAEKRFAPPVEFYSAPEAIRAGYKYPPGYFENLMIRRAFVRRDFNQSMGPGDYSLWTREQCLSHLGDAVIASATPEPQLDATLEQTAPAQTPDSAGALVTSLSSDSIARCMVFANHIEPNAISKSTEPAAQIIALSTEGIVVGIYDRESRKTMKAGVLEAELFAQYYGDKPVLRKVVTFASGDVPPLCLNALLAIEDSQFYEHPGISVTGLARALITNLRGRPLQGGSTITQQLVKNFFLTDERTLKRKLVEIVMAFLVEQHASKDDILETYINLIYMGQNGPFEVRGFAAASEHYFGKPLRNLELNECALLAAVLNGPGVYDPNRHPDRALKRRTRVINRMLDLQLIDDAKALEANATPLPSKPQRSLTEPAPYFVQAVRRELMSRNIDLTEGLRVYTTLNLRAQEAAQQAVRSGLERLEKNNTHIQKMKAAGKSLEALLISSDPTTGYIEALVGGRGFLATQFNRAIDSRRQVGSVMKPFVYLTALEHMTEDGQPYTPLTLLQDRSTTHKFEGQTWTPRNYDGAYQGDVPLFWALKESLNASTVNLGMSVGLSNIVDTAKRMGVTSKISALPSLTLGAFELSPMEVLQAYGTISQLGTKVPLSLLAKVESLAGDALYEVKPVGEQVVASEVVSELVGVMKQSLISGTGRGVRALGFLHPAAGKTGTTNDKKDAWFAGFTPHHTAIVWVGYDDNTSHNLTGGSGAVPIWTDYMKSYASSQTPDDFPWPAGTEKFVLTDEQQTAFGVPEKNAGAPREPIELIFKAGQAPTAQPTPTE